MPRWLPRALVLALALYSCFLLGSWAFHQLVGLLVNILLAFFLDLAIEPAVGRMAARGMRRGLATFLVFFAVLVFSVGFVVIYQQFENYVLQPKLTSKTVDIHPAVAFGSVIAGTALLGAVGALIAIPAVATLQAFLGAYVKRYDVTDDPRVHGHRRYGEAVVARLQKALHHKKEKEREAAARDPSAEEPGARRSRPEDS